MVIVSETLLRVLFIFDVDGMMCIRRGSLFVSVCVVLRCIRGLV